ncbi:CD209 antigen-like protein D [Larimichthys crocea]|uniref:Uncharacterized protein n=2 Tax=Larimichthys crocea TaxID=215358 RepID=A0ACD3RXP3_LARCR|nr:CD209 antigen-like protein E [Larimichthys crocea]KAE8300721.1 CD209 antigen-like protein D [Larimichthys crocea]TMS23543.1 CD209 antigen-like protein A [Larimichthys crocea]
MVKFVHKEESEITMDYVNLPALPGGDALKSCSGKDGGVTAAVPGMKVYRLVAVSFGLLCILQGALNISLRLALDYSDTKVPDKEASCNNLTKESAELRGKLVNFHYYFNQGWVYFHPSFYYISSVMKSWNDSRDDCLQRGADLMIINSKEEQEFSRKFHKLTWIGLTERETKGVWKWVDGTTLTESYWGPGEPNDNKNKAEECVELRFHDIENSWNDISCKNQNFWICEKIITI